jgi:hypothetical protein
MAEPDIDLFVTLLFEKWRPVVSTTNVATTSRHPPPTKNAAIQIKRPLLDQARHLLSSIDLRTPGLPDGLFFKPKIPLWVNFGEP